MSTAINYISQLFARFKESIRAEFLAIFRDKGALLLIVIALPLYTIIYATAYGSEVVRDVAIAVVDNDKTSSSRELIDGIACGPNTLIRFEPQSIIEAQQLFYKGLIYGIVYIPNDFERNLLQGTVANIGLILDGSHLLLYRQVLEQIASNTLTQGATVELMRLVGRGESKQAALDTINPVELDIHHLYNRSLGYGSFVMPPVVIVIIQQTLVIGLSMIAARRRTRGLNRELLSPLNITAKLLVYIFIYTINLTIILCTIWQIFGFPFTGSLGDIAIFTTLYISSVTALGLAVAQFFKHREAPLMLLLCTTIPILLLAGVSYPREAFPSWLYHLGRLLPSSSGIDGFIALASRGATLSDVVPEIATLIILTFAYLLIAHLINIRVSRNLP
ncbi:MAG: ABC transporter permease [Alistipes sp.]|nr:ABC transporter permease [Alistipes sp.]